MSHTLVDEACFFEAGDHVNGKTQNFVGTRQKNIAVAASRRVCVATARTS